MYIAKSKIGPSEVGDTSHPDQRRMGLFCGWIWSMDENSLFDESSFDTLEHLSTWSCHFLFSFFVTFFSLLFLIAPCLLFV